MIPTKGGYLPVELGFPLEGLDLVTPPTLMTPGATPSCSNWEFFRGSIRLRSGYQGTGSTLTYPILALCPFQLSDGSRKLVAVTATKVWDITNPSSPVDLTRTSNNAVKLTKSASNGYSVGLTDEPHVGDYLVTQWWGDATVTGWVGRVVAIDNSYYYIETLYGVLAGGLGVCPLYQQKITLDYTRTTTLTCAGTEPNSFTATLVSPPYSNGVVGWYVESGAFNPGDTVTQEVTGATGVFTIASDSSNSYEIKVLSGTFSNKDSINNTTSGRPGRLTQATVGKSGNIPTNNLQHITIQSGLSCPLTAPVVDDLVVDWAVGADTTLGNILVITNGIDPPVYWNGVDTTVKLVPMNDSTFRTTKFVEFFKNHFVFINILAQGEFVPDSSRWILTIPTGTIAGIYTLVWDVANQWFVYTSGNLTLKVVWGSLYGWYIYGAWTGGSPWNVLMRVYPNIPASWGSLPGPASPPAGTKPLAATLIGNDISVGVYYKVSGDTTIANNIALGSLLGATKGGQYQWQPSSLEYSASLNIQEWENLNSGFFILPGNSSEITATTKFQDKLVLFSEEVGGLYFTDPDSIFGYQTIMKGTAYLISGPKAICEMNGFLLFVGQNNLLAWDGSNVVGIGDKLEPCIRLSSPKSKTTLFLDPTTNQAILRICYGGVTSHSSGGFRYFRLEFDRRIRWLVDLEQPSKVRWIEHYLPEDMFSWAASLSRVSQSISMDEPVQVYCGSAAGNLYALDSSTAYDKVAGNHNYITNTWQTPDFTIPKNLSSQLARWIEFELEVEGNGTEAGDHINTMAITYSIDRGVTWVTPSSNTISFLSTTTATTTWFKVFIDTTSRFIRFKLTGSGHSISFTAFRVWFRPGGAR